MNETVTIAKLVEENCELKRGIGDLILTISERMKGRTHIFIDNKAPQIEMLLSQIDWYRDFLLTKKEE